MTPGADPGISKLGGYGPDAVEFLRSGDCLNAPSHILYLFRCESRDKNTYRKHCMLAMHN